MPAYSLNENAVEHAVAPEAPLEMHARVDDGRLWLEFRDRGQAFDPTAYAAPALDADIGERGIGGLGVFLVQELAEDIAYQRVDGCNVLQIRLGRIPDSNGGRSHDAQDHS